MEPADWIKIGGAIALSLTTAIGILWKQVAKRSEATEMELKETRDKMFEMSENMGNMKETMGEFKGREKGIEELSAKVLQEIHTIKKDSKE